MLRAHNSLWPALALACSLEACSDGGAVDPVGVDQPTGATTSATRQTTVSGGVTSTTTSVGGSTSGQGGGAVTSSDGSLASSTGASAATGAGGTTSTASSDSSVTSGTTNGSSNTSGGGFGGTSSTLGGAGGTASTTATTGAMPTEPVTVFLAGDSIVQTYQDTASTTDQAGWGQMFGDFFDSLVTVENHAIGGRTARRFIEEGRLQEIADALHAGDYLFVQFGTNDGNTTATYELNGQTIPYYLDPDTDFKTYLAEYIQVAREHDATLVFVTPTPRNSAYCTGGNGTGAHAEAMRELGAAESVNVSDLNAKTVTYLTSICPAPTPEDFFFVRQDGSVDGTHFQENGARILASFVAEGVAEANLPLASYLK